MKYAIVAVKDNAAEFFQPVTQVRAKGEALRAFADAINNAQNAQLHQHPQDFDLYLIGYFDDQEGSITPLDKPERMMRGIDAKAT